DERCGVSGGKPKEPIIELAPVGLALDSVPRSIEHAAPGSARNGELHSNDVVAEVVFSVFFKQPVASLWREAIHINGLIVAARNRDTRLDDQRSGNFRRTQEFQRRYIAGGHRVERLRFEETRPRKLRRHSCFEAGECRIKLRRITRKARFNPVTEQVLEFRPRSALTKRFQRAQALRLGNQALEFSLLPE